MQTSLEPNKDTIVIHLPLKLNRRSGRKYLIAPDGATVPAVRETEPLHTMQRALGRAFLWRREIEAGKYEGMRDLARKNKYSDDYVFRQMTLTFLAPSIIEAILNNKMPKHVTLQQLYKVTLLLWEEQETAIIA